MFNLRSLFALSTTACLFWFTFIFSSQAKETQEIQPSSNPENILHTQEFNIIATKEATPQSSSPFVTTPIHIPNNPFNPSENTTPQYNLFNQPKVPNKPNTENNSGTTLPIVDLAPLEPNPNPLLFPTTKEEVTIQKVQAITLQQALELASRNNQELQIARLNLEKAQEGVREAYAEEYPTLSTQWDFTRTDSATASLQQNQNTLFQRNNSTISTNLTGTFELSYDVYTSGKVTAQIALAQNQVKVAQLDFDRINEEIIYNVTREYYALQNADAQIGIQQASVENAQQNLKVSKSLEEAGVGTYFDVLRAKVDLANSQQQLTLAYSNQNIARRQLVKRLGLAEDADIKAADSIDVAGKWPLSLEETIVQAYKNRAELEQLLVENDIEHNRETISNSTTAPQVSLFANYNMIGSLDDSIGPEDGYTFGARLRWTLFDGGATKAKVAQNQIQQSVINHTFADQRDKIRFEVEQAYYTLQANAQNIETAQKTIELATESLRLARLRFQAEVGTQTDLINAKTELTTAQGNLLRAIVEYNTALASLKRAVSNYPDGQLFDLPSVNTPLVNIP